MKTAQFILLLVSVAVLSSCTRKTEDLSKITITMPILTKNSALRQKTSQQMTAQNSFTDALLPVGKKACFGIDVSGPGISGRASTACAPEMGIYSGFIEEGVTITLDIPKGDSRVFKVGVYPQDADLPCPTMDESFFTKGGPFSNVFSIGQVVQNLTAENEVVNIPVTYDDTITIAEQFGLTTCSGPASLHGLLYSSGDIVANDYQPFTFFDQSAPYVESFYTSTSDLGFSVYEVGVISSSNLYENDNLDFVQLIEYGFSFTRKPDTDQIFALDHGGNILEMSSIGILQSFAPGYCPFTSCAVPIWIQSISAGYGTDLFGLDHSGNIYQVQTTGLVPTGQQVDPFVAQVSYY